MNRVVALFLAIADRIFPRVCERAVKRQRGKQG